MVLRNELSKQMIQEYFFASSEDLRVIVAEFHGDLVVFFVCRAVCERLFKTGQEGIQRHPPPAFRLFQFDGFQRSGARWSIPGDQGELPVGAGSALLPFLLGQRTLFLRRTQVVSEARIQQRPLQGAVHGAD